MGGPLIQYAWCPFKKAATWQKQRAQPCWPRNTEDYPCPPDAGRSKDRPPSWSLEGSTGLPPPRFWTSGLQDCGRMYSVG